MSKKIQKPPARIVVIEVTSCGGCPHLDSRWTTPPWRCSKGVLNISNTGAIHRQCPLTTKRDYVAENAARCAD